MIKNLTLATGDSRVVEKGCLGTKVGMEVGGGHGGGHRGGGCGHGGGGRRVSQDGFPSDR